MGLVNISLTSFHNLLIKLMYWIREAVPNLTEDEEYRGPVQEPPTKKRRTLGEGTQRNRHTEEQTDTQRNKQTHRGTERNRHTEEQRGTETFLCLCIVVYIAICCQYVIIL